MSGREASWQRAEVKSPEPAHVRPSDPEKGWIDNEAVGAASSPQWTASHYGDKEESTYLWTSTPNMAHHTEDDPHEGLLRVLVRPTKKPFNSQSHANGQSSSIFPSLIL